MPPLFETTLPSKTPPPLTAEDSLGFTNAPNLLTLARILLTPIVVGLLFLKDPTWDVVAALVFAVASITDYFDGYLARKRNLETVYGKLMDPLADKFLIVSSLIVLQTLGRIPAILVIVLICREMAITNLRALASAEGLVLGASSIAKWKTATQMIAIPLIMGRDGLWGIPLYTPGLVLLYLSLAISLISAKDYLVDFFRSLKLARLHKTRERKLAREARNSARAARFSARLAAAQQKIASLTNPPSD